MDVLDKEDLGGEVLSEPHYGWDVLIPVQVLLVDFDDGPTRNWLGGTVKRVESVVNDLAQLAEAVEDGADVGRLCRITTIDGLDQAYERSVSGQPSVICRGTKVKKLRRMYHYQ